MSWSDLFCPAGLCCLSLMFAGITIWWHAFPKWPSLAISGQTLAGGALIALIVVVPMQVQAQTAPPDMTRDEAKAEARALADSLEAGVQAGATQTVDGNSVPGFVTDAPPETAHYGNAPGLESAGTAQSFANDTALFVHDSMASRPIISQAELDTWTANGLSIEANAQSIVTEYSGTYGDCTTTVSGGTAGTSYQYACNEGDTLVQFNDTCAIPLNVTFDQDYVYRCTWNWVSNDYTYAPDSNCAVLFANPTCGNWTYVSGTVCRVIDPWTCSIGDTDLVLEATCTDPVPPLTPNRTISAGPPIDHWDTAFCDLKDTDPTCTLVSETCVEPAATRVIDGQSVTRDCWRHERTYQCAALGGVVDDCNVPPDCALDQSICLSSDDTTGACRTYEHTYTCSTPGTSGGAVGYCADDVYCIDGDCEPLTRPQNDEFHQAVSALSILGELQNDVDQNTLEIFPGEYAKCDKAIAGLQNCCSNDGFLVSIGFGCSANDQALAQRQQAGLCHYVGTYCSKKTLFGICLKKRKTFCCFNNKLARIIHEQGRPQVGQTWGSIKSPDCSGFTVALFQQLDLSVMDFSEFYNEVLATYVGPDTDAATAAIRDRIINAYQCPPNC
ncbi:MAG: conjugal transfer protein TraN [Pseudomonadota bacterium]